MPARRLCRYPTSPARHPRRRAALPAHGLHWDVVASLSKGQPAFVDTLTPLHVAFVSTSVQQLIAFVGTQTPLHVALLSGPAHPHVAIMGTRSLHCLKCGLSSSPFCLLVHTPPLCFCQYANVTAVKLLLCPYVAFVGIQLRLHNAFVGVQLRLHNAFVGVQLRLHIAFVGVRPHPHIAAAHHYDFIIWRPACCPSFVCPKGLLTARPHSSFVRPVPTLEGGSVSRDLGHKVDTSSSCLEGAALPDGPAAVVDHRVEE
ncbi:hypothetical protein B0H19DRAFT_1275771 [Mycena capillaripes]|nr:hypothetical protein B0H19DRAFT_1275771 [Mycena capillaripes]